MSEDILNKLLTTVLTFLIAIIVWGVKRMFDQHDKNFELHAKRIEANEKRLDKHGNIIGQIVTNHNATKCVKITKIEPLQVMDN